MAITSVLRMTFIDSLGKSKNFNVRYAKTTIVPATVKTLMNTITQNGDVFAAHYTMNKGAKLIQTDTTEIDIS